MLIVVQGSRRAFHHVPVPLCLSRPWSPASPPGLEAPLPDDIVRESVFSNVVLPSEILPSRMHLERITYRYSSILQFVYRSTKHLFASHLKRWIVQAK